MKSFSSIPACLLLGAVAVTGWHYDVSNARQAVEILDPAPVGVSIEFFTFPSYATNVTSTYSCLRNLARAMNKPAPIRIGGTTQERATFDPSSLAYVTYSVAAPTDAPLNLTYGPKFMDLAASMPGPTTLGLNRELNNISNTIMAAKVAKERMGNLYAFELGNEPSQYSNSSPIAVNGSWDPALDRASQISWQASVGEALNSTDIIQAGVYLEPPKWSTALLAPEEGASAKYVRSFSDHAYPQSACGGASTNLSLLMSHSSIVEFTSQFRVEAEAAHNISKHFFFGETNSATCGGGGISPTFGAALWIVDFVLQAINIGTERLYFHQGTIGNCPYCWWDREEVYATFYGAFFVAEAVSGMDSMAMLDDGTSPYAVYGFYKHGKLKRVLLYNSDIYTNVTVGGRPTEAFTLTGLGKTSIKTKRLTAPYATSLSGQTVGGQQFTNGTCEVQGEEVFQYMGTVSGQATFQVPASEAWLVYLG